MLFQGFKLLGLLAIVSFLGAAVERPARSQGKTAHVYVGTYTQGDSQGIYLFELDLTSGELTPSGLAAEVKNPSFVAIHPNGRFLYSVNEVADLKGIKSKGGKSGAVTAFAIDKKTKKLTKLNHQSTGGGGPCYLVVDASGKNVLAANYGGGSICSLPIQKDGSIGEATSFIQHSGSSVNPRRQAGPHAHSINLDPAGKFAVAADLGLDKVLVYRFDADKGTLAANDPPAADALPGAGPRHFSFHPSGRFGYVCNEIFSSVTAFAYDAEKGKFSTLHTISTLPEDYDGKGNSTAEVQVHRSGKFLYCSNRGHNSIAMYAIDQQTGKLRRLGNEPTGGEIPRNFGIDPTGAFLLAANQNSNDITVFRINQKTGRLKATGYKVSTPRPVCVKMMLAK